MPLLQVNSIGKGTPEAPVLSNVSFSLKKRQRLGIMGETGSGKSTLLKIIGGRDQANAGTVIFEGAPVPGTEEKLLPGHPGIAYLSQQHHLPQHLRVEQVLEYAANEGIANPNSLYAWCRIDHLLQRKTHQLSGGEQQRVATACLLLGSPRLLLLDEPFSNLDVIHKSLMKSILAQAEERLGLTTVLVSHDPLDILSWADEVLLMKNGVVIEAIGPETAYHQPTSEYTAALLGAYTFLPPQTLALWGMKAPAGSKGAIVRPEGFRVRESHNPVGGIVTSVQFMGNGYRLEVALPTQSVRVHVTGAAPERGSTITLALQMNALSFISK
jgi:iron(III) transport system ATP-binding protein